MLTAGSQGRGTLSASGAAVAACHPCSGLFGGAWAAASASGSCGRAAAFEAAFAFTFADATAS